MNATAFNQQSRFLFFSQSNSLGWASVALDTKMHAVELTCRSQGSPACIFKMSPANRIAQYVKNYVKTVSTNLVEQQEMMDSLIGLTLIKE